MGIAGNLSGLLAIRLRLPATGGGKTAVSVCESQPLLKRAAASPG
jgi:hypothetical protein